MDDIFTPWEWFCSYNEEQLEMLRNIYYRRTTGMPEIQKEINKDLLQNINKEGNKEGNKENDK